MVFNKLFQRVSQAPTNPNAPSAPRGFDVADLYRGSRVWSLSMRIYESLWTQPRGTLVKGSVDSRLDQDALLGARLVRGYSKDWLGGAGRFAALCLPYLIDDEKCQQAMTRVWNDTEDWQRRSVRHLFPVTSRGKQFLCPERRFGLIRLNIGHVFPSVSVLIS